jgi:dienelactone hydrolase
MWGELWAGAGYMALLVDGFGPRGYPHGFPRFSYRDRPAEVDEATVRPLDAYGALAYLRTRPDVVPDRIGLMGWSNGGSATLAAMAVGAPGIATPTPATGFRAALVFYPGCGLKGRFAHGYRPYAPVRVFHGTGDEEVSPRRCGDLVVRARDPRLRRPQPQAARRCGQRQRRRGRNRACPPLLCRGAAAGVAPVGPPPCFAVPADSGGGCRCHMGGKMTCAPPDGSHSR